MCFVPVAQSLEDLDRGRVRRLGDLDGLELALERRVLLQVLAVLVQCRRADRLQLAAGQHRLEYRGRVDRALRGSSANRRVDLIKTQVDAPAGTDLLEHLLQPLFEIAAVARAGHQRAQVKGVELLVLERLWHLALDDALRQAFYHGLLADPGLADQDGVVLGAPRQDLHDPLDFLLPSDDGVELAFARCGGQVPAELVEHQGSGGSALRRGASRGRLLALVAVEQLDDLLAHAVEISAEPDEHLGGDALALADQPEQDVLGADVIVTKLQCFAQRELKHLLGSRRERDMTGRSLLALPDNLFDLLAHGFKADAKRLKCLGSDALALVDEAKQYVLSTDVVVIQHPGLFLSQDHNPPRPVGKPLKHSSLPHHATRTVATMAPSLPRTSPYTGEGWLRQAANKRPTALQ